MILRSSDLTVTDMFCGAGGSSIGAEAAGAKLRMAMNHWKLALETHGTNFPHADHDCTDISATDPRRYPRTDILLASPECTNHSLAKGAKRKGLSQFDAFIAITADPSAERSRATMWDVVRFAEFHRYDAVIVENVVDVHHWEPFRAWLSAMHSLGYEHREVYLNSMFAHPTPQSRDRIYIVFWRKGNRAPDLEIRPTGFCNKCERDCEAIQSWKKPHKPWGRYRAQYVYRCPSCATEVTPYYYAALNAIDWSIPAERVGDRVGHKKLKPRTLERIEYGLKKYGSTPLVVTTRYTTGVDFRVRPAAADALPTQPGDASHALVMPWIVNTRQGLDFQPSRVRAGSDPAFTQTGDACQGIALPPGCMMTYRNIGGGSYPCDPFTAPLRTLTTENQYRILINGSALLTMRDSRGMGYLLRPLTDALGTQVAAATQDFLIQRTPFLVSYYGQDQASGGADAMGTLSTRDRHALIELPEEDLNVDDCFFRMLVPPEVGAGMAFPSTYTVLGTKRERVKQYGNAVTPPAQEILVKRVAESLAA